MRSKLKEFTFTTKSAKDTQGFDIFESNFVFFVTSFESSCERGCLGRHTRERIRLSAAPDSACAMVERASREDLHFILCG